MDGMQFEADGSNVSRVPDPEEETHNSIVAVNPGADSGLGRSLNRSIGKQGNEFPDISEEYVCDSHRFQLGSQKKPIAHDLNRDAGHSSLHKNGTLSKEGKFLPLVSHNVNTNSEEEYVARNYPSSIKPGSKSLDEKIVSPNMEKFKNLFDSVSTKLGYKHDKSCISLPACPGTYSDNSFLRVTVYKECVNLGTQYQCDASNISESDGAVGGTKGNRCLDDIDGYIDCHQNLESSNNDNSSLDKNAPLNQCQKQTCPSVTTSQQQKQRSRKPHRRKAYGKARYPEHSTYQTRLDSYSEWKYHEYAAPEDLASAGLFYTGTADKVKCFVSGCGLHGWEKADNPVKEHLGWFPACKYAQIRSSSPDRLLEFKDSTAVRATLQFGYSERILEKAFNILQDKGNMNPSASQLLDVVFKLQKKDDGYVSEEEKESDPNNSEEDPDPDLERDVNITKAHFTRREHERLNDEVSRLERVMKCFNCKEKQANMVNLPCGHLATCEGCVYKNNKCARCKTLIKGVVKVFML